MGFWDAIAGVIIADRIMTVVIFAIMFVFLFALLIVGLLIGG